MPKRSSSIDTIDQPPRRVLPQAVPPPWWVTALDIASLGLLLFLLRALAGDGARFVIADGLRITFTSWPRNLAWLTACVVLRHMVWRTDPLWQRIRRWLDSLVRAAPMRASWGPFIASRLLVSAVGFVAVVMFDPQTRTRILLNPVLDLWTRYDAAWYARIAALGYSTTGPFNPASEHPIAFFPGLPISMRVVGRIFGIEFWYAGILLVIVAFLAGLAVLYLLAREDLSEDQARASLLFLAFYPFATCYSAVLTEAPFLLSAAASFLLFRRHRPLAAAPFALFAGFLRPNGFLLSIPLALLTLIPWARSRGWIPGSEDRADGGMKLTTKLLVACLPVLSLLIHCAFVHSQTGDPFAWAKAQQAWGRTTAGLLDVVSARWDLIRDAGWSAYPRAYPIEILEGAAALCALGLVWPITRRFGLAYGALVALAVFPPFFTMGSVSLGRYTAPLFPIFLWLGATVPAERRIYWIAAFAAGQALVATLFFTGRPPY